MSAAVLVDYIDKHRTRFGVEPICIVSKTAGMQIAPSTYYSAKARRPPARAVADEQRLAVIRKVHADNDCVYGVRKMHARTHPPRPPDRALHGPRLTPGSPRPGRA